jgi:hypothetical protein
VGEMVVYETELSFDIWKHLAETVFTATLVPHAYEIARGIEQGTKIRRTLAEYNILQIVQESRARARPSLTQEIDVSRINVCEIHASADC